MYHWIIVLFTLFQAFSQKDYCKKHLNNIQNDLVYLVRKYARIFVCGHYLYLKAHTEFSSNYALVKMLASPKLPNKNFCLFLNGSDKQNCFLTKLFLGVVWTHLKCSQCASRQFKIKIIYTGGGVPPYKGYIGMCGPKGDGFSAVLVVNRVSIFADFSHFDHKQGMVFVLQL